MNRNQVLRILLFAGIAAAVLNVFAPGNRVAELPYSEFLQLVERQEVSDIVVTGDRVTGKLAE